jgi:hypothetical protein
MRPDRPTPVAEDQDVEVTRSDQVEEAMQMAGRVMGCPGIIACGEKRLLQTRAP